MNKAISYNNPHFCQMKYGSKGITLDNKPWSNCTINRHNNGINDKVYINHYVFQSYEDFVRRKIKRARDDNYQMRKPVPENKLHKLFNDCDNTFLKDNYT